MIYTKTSNTLRVLTVIITSDKNSFHVTMICLYASVVPAANQIKNILTLLYKLE